MKKLLALLLLFGIVGCASTNNPTSSQLIDMPLEVSSKSISQIEKFIIVDSYNELSSTYKYMTELQAGDSLKAEAMNTSSGEKWHVGNYPFRNIRSWVMSQCKIETQSQCVLSRYLDETYYSDLDDYKKKKAEEDLKSKKFSKKMQTEKKSIKEKYYLIEKDREERRFLELECKLDKNLLDESRFVKIQIEINKSSSGSYYGSAWYPKSSAPPFHRGYIIDNRVKYELKYISVSDKEITGVVDMNFLSLYELTINRYSGSITAEASSDDYDRSGECEALEEQKF